MIKTKAETLMEKMPPKQNILYLSVGGNETNFYYRIMHCPFTNVVKKHNIENITLEPYDGFVISFSIFREPELSTELVDRIIDLKKPVIIIYNSLYSEDYEGYQYLSNKYKIKFKELDCSIIEDSYDDYSIGNVRHDGYAVSMKFSSGYGKCFIKTQKIVI